MLIRETTSEELMSQLDYYNEQAWTDVPKSIRERIEARYILVPSREPTEQEIWETISDAREHRITNKELTIQDYLDKYKHGKSFNII
jgi:hypothetical protein